MQILTYGFLLYIHYVLYMYTLTLRAQLTISSILAMTNSATTELEYKFCSATCHMFTAFFTHMQILRFKSQLIIAFFTAVNHLNGPLRKQNFTSMGSKGYGLWFVISGFRSFLCVSVFQGSLPVIVIMIDGSEKCNKNLLWRWLFNFRVCMFVKSTVKKQNI